jgi:hypothetical protein
MAVEGGTEDAEDLVVVICETILVLAVLDAPCFQAAAGVDCRRQD